MAAVDYSKPSTDQNGKSEAIQNSDAKFQVSVAAESTPIRLNGFEESTKIQIASDEKKPENEDAEGDDEKENCDNGEDPSIKPLASQNYGNFGSKNVLSDSFESRRDSRPSFFRDTLVGRWWQTKRREWRLMLFVLFLLLLIVVGLAVVYRLSRHDLHHFYHHEQSFVVHKSELTVRFASPSGGHTVLSGTLWKDSGSRGRPYDCSGGREDSRAGLCLLWRNARRLEIEHFDEDGAACTRIRWQFLSSESDDGSECFWLGDGAKWFGPGILRNASATLENAFIPRQAFVTGDRHGSGAFGPVLERLFLGSEGVAIVVEANSSFDLSVNGFDPSGLDPPSRQLCLHRSSPAAAAANGEFSYLVCIADSIKRVRESALSLLAPNPPPSPPEPPRNLPEVVSGSPVWSTWAYFKDRFNHSSLTDFAQKIDDEFKGGTSRLLMIDEGWESSIGDLEFTTSKFADPRSTIDALRSMNFRVSLGVRTQVSTESAAFRNVTVQRRLVQVPGTDGGVPALARRWIGPRGPRWDRGLAGAYDLTDPTAYEALRERLVRAREAYGVDTFHVGGTEVSSLPRVRSGRMAGDPNEYTRRGAELASGFGPLASAEASAEGGAQVAPAPMIRLRDGASTWDGLRSVIPDALTLGLLGYPVFMLDSVGGSAYDGFPTKELYLRWFQASAFLPVVHLSVPPWHYDAETVATVRNILGVRETLVLPEIRSIFEGDSSGLIRSSIVRPIWWPDPSDDQSLDVTTEFLVGDNILVAPVLEEGKLERNIYLPKGTWKDSAGELYRGPTWLHGYAANLTCLPYFTRV